MSTQHPDNVAPPFFAESPEMGGEDEIQEAFYAFSHLDCGEQMWDCEGKEVDGFVVKKLLSRYEAYFRRERLGRDVRLTLRVPNPTVERDEAKVLLETLESIPRSFDTARLFYQDDAPPIFEVILPMTQSALSLDRVYRYYRDFVVGKKRMAFGDGDVTLAEWIGDFRPETIDVIPLFEDLDHMMSCAEITAEYLSDKDVKAQRVFLARSDPAMEYGQVSAVLMNKAALDSLQRLEDETGTRMLPIIGVGSAPFRGGLTPATTRALMREYPSVQTFTVQSAFKYDWPHDQVRRGVRDINEGARSRASEVDSERCLEIITKCAASYRRQVKRLAPRIVEASQHVPRRRKRKLHIGLFGYSRTLEGMRMPRAIGFCCSLYSIGIPPEILGLDALTERDLDFVRDASPHFDRGMRQALEFMSPESMELLPPEAMEGVERLGLEVDRDEEHAELASQMLKALGGSQSGVEELVLRAAYRRGFLG